MKSINALLVALAFASIVFAQDIDTAYVPFVVNVDASIKAKQGENVILMEVTAGEMATLNIPLEKNLMSVMPRAQNALNNVPVITGNHLGKISLNLSCQIYKTVELSLYSLNGKRILRAKADASQASKNISRPKLVEGVYLLLVKGANGHSFSSRFTHRGGSLNINVVFRNENVLTASPVAAESVVSESDIWTITVFAAGYIDSSYSFVPAKGMNPLQNITLIIGNSDTDGTFTDARDGQTYKYVIIDTQVWMAENLNYNAGGSVCYGGKPSNCDIYGRLYNWSAVMAGASGSNSNSSGVQGVCPVGWHVPSDVEWQALVDYVDPDYVSKTNNVAGTMLKSQTGWSGYLNGNDVFDFTALPGGYVAGSGSSYHDGTIGYWWSATELNANYGMRWSISDNMASANALKPDQYSVRCLHDVGHTHTWGDWLITTPATCTAPGIETRTCEHHAGHIETRIIPQYTWSDWLITTPATCTAPGVETSTCTQDASFTKTREIAQLRGWDACGTFFTDARDGKRYRYVTIGTQVWMAQNLNYSSSSVGSFCYGDDPDNCDKYGRLYDWGWATDKTSSSANPSGVRGICPAGWHIPSDAEWQTLVEYVDPNFVSNYNNIAGTKLKSQTGWNDKPNGGSGNGTDDYGFSALPGGSGFNHNSDSYKNIGDVGYWWSATEDGADTRYAVYRDINNEYGTAYKSDFYKVSAYSVRCVRN